jgi:hypothetical protein
MLHRFSKHGLICIAQHNHAWLSGQFAQAWGNDDFGQFFPPEDVCLGAQQHDVGWLAWEQAPTLNPQTGYPHNFLELSTKLHIDIWSRARELALPLGEYVALLVSLHGTGLYERFRSWQNSKTSAPIVENFLKSEYSFQEQMIATLQKDAYYAPYVTLEVIKRNRQLMATWDALSIIVCQGFVEQEQITQVPTIDGETTLKLTLKENKDNYHQVVALSPWPFQDSEVQMEYEGRLLQQTFTNEKAMQEALMSDRGISLSLTLKPG